MEEAKFLTGLTSPRVRLEAEYSQLSKEIENLHDGPEYQLKHARMQELEHQINEVEVRQTETLSDQQVVDLVENAIRPNPQDFPLLTKYYPNVE